MHVFSACSRSKRILKSDVFSGAKSTENLADTGDTPKGSHRRQGDSDSVSSNEWPNRPS